jgi:hypothetical protein
MPTLVCQPHRGTEADWFQRSCAIFKKLVSEVGSDTAGQAVSVHPQPNPTTLRKPDGSRIDAPTGEPSWRSGFNPYYTFPALAQLGSVGLRDAHLAGRRSFYWDPLHAAQPNGPSASAACTPRCPQTHCRRPLWDAGQPQVSRDKGYTKRWLYDCTDKILMVGPQYTCGHCNCAWALLAQPARA